MVITDSGGIQEETTYLGVPCLTVRENTDRPITAHLGTNIGRRIRSRLASSRTSRNILGGRGKRGECASVVGRARRRAHCRSSRRSTVSSACQSSDRVRHGRRARRFLDRLSRSREAAVRRRRRQLHAESPEVEAAHEENAAARPPHRHVAARDPPPPRCHLEAIHDTTDFWTTLKPHDPDAVGGSTT